ncbi:RNA 2',3'-cyclic phosphodiesterase [Streptomyces brevispora]|uniref:RNA 2',3'-cyclic phosphodiesterase n=1 Tax=Streptomyces brevispora TaxID=887462 RepID=A0A561UZQ9_9ACTN|nr:RNA 2',3'-cyclic phosphodiesterase [Streptomyces brevispora]TWG04829.1 2'-5' RNA ligase [Streptomyces brevispora]WSC14098.1 RNA 2',3'-cyclic phosphodiesterase [Streptomyces brevispora]
MSRTRLFTAVLPPDPALRELRRAVAPLHALPGADALRWTGPAGRHFTLAFLGNVDEEVLPDLYSRLERAAHRTPAFPLRVHGAGRFGGRVLWAGAAGDLDTMRLLAERAHAAARRAGLPMEEHRRYTPHLTLARSRDEADLAPFTAALGGFEGMRWETGELSLVRSDLPVDGVPGEQPRYEVVRAWPLGR